MFNAILILKNIGAATRRKEMIEQFIKIPFQLLKDDGYSSLSLNAVVLYSLLLDRLESSKKNGDKFKDENGEFYAVMTRDEIVDLLRVGKNKVPKIKKELIDHGLLEEKNRGSRTTLYYPQKLKIESGNVGLHALVKAENWSPETGLNDVPEPGTNQTTVLATRQSNNVDRDFQTLHNLALGALQKMHFSSNEFQVFQNDVREATYGNRQEFELIKLAIEEARKSNASSWNYVSTILKSWRAKGIKGEEDLYANKRKRKEEQLPELPDWLGL